MSKQLIERLRKGREVRIPCGRFTFIALRPTDLQMLGVNKLVGEAQAQRLLEFVTGWEGVVEDDIGGGASTDPVKFSPELWQSWAADHPEFWGPIAEAVYGAYETHAGAEAATAKN